MSSQKKEKNYKLFINNLDSWFSNFLIETFRTDHLPDFKNKYEISGNISNWKNDLPLYFTPSKIIDIDYDLSYNSDLFKNDIYIYNLNTGNINEIKYIINGLKENKFDNEKTFILISNIMTWAKTPVKIKDNENEDENYDERIYVEPIDEDEERERIRKEQEEKERKEREKKEREEKEKEEKEKEEKSKKKKKTEKEEKEKKKEEKKKIKKKKIKIYKIMKKKKIMKIMKMIIIIIIMLLLKKMKMKLKIKNILFIILKMNIQKEFHQENIININTLKILY